MVMVPSGAGLVASPPSGPGVAQVAGGAAHGRGGEAGQAAGLGDADLDQAGVVAGGLVIRAGGKFPGVAPGCPAARRCWRAGRCQVGLAGRRRWPAAPGRTWTARYGGGRSATAGPGAGPGRPGPCRGQSILQSATADTPEAETISSLMPGSRAILSVGALLQAATVVRRLRSAAAGERDAAECRECGAFRSPDLDGPAAGTADCGGRAAGDAGGQGRGPHDERRS